MIEEIKLTNTTSIYKIKFDFFYNRQSYIERAYETINLKKTHTGDKKHFFYIPFRSAEIDYLNQIVLDICSSLSNIKYKEWAVQNWIYIMDYNTENEIYHTHKDLIEYDGRIQTDWTFCFYIQMPKNIKEDEGKISFKTNDKNEYLLLPEEGDLIIFPADLLHTPKLIKNSEMDRIVIAGNISLNPLKKIKNKVLV